VCLRRYSRPVVGNSKCGAATRRTGILYEGQADVAVGPGGVADALCGVFHDVDKGLLEEYFVERCNRFGLRKFHCQRAVLACYAVGHRFQKGLAGVEPSGYIEAFEPRGGNLHYVGVA